jgi:hypothetical protein
MIAGNIRSRWESLMNPHPQVLVPSAPHAAELQWQVLCPHCGDAAVDRADFVPDHKAVTVYPDRDEYDSPIGTRGGYVQIDLQCMVGHGFALVVANHKGAEFLAVVPSIAD